MTLRDRLNANGAVAIAFAVTALVGAYGLYRWLAAPGGAAVEHASYMHEETGEVVRADADALPPLPDASGRAALVRVIENSDGSPAFLMKYEEGAKSALEALRARRGTPEAAQPPTPEQAAALRGEGVLVRMPQPGSPWVSRTSDEGRRVTGGR